jgi:hypothetical protein
MGVQSLFLWAITGGQIGQKTAPAAGGGKNDKNRTSGQWQKK